MDQKMMAEAICEARKALAHKDVPIGAVVVLDGEIIGRGHNTRERDHDPSGHAEINAMRDAAQTLGRWQLDGATLYVTHEPCPMCAGSDASGARADGGLRRRRADVRRLRQPDESATVPGLSK